ncbi:ergothioneine biosynthesis protein EgtB [Lysobacter sp. H21R4]|uniref:ergothioneine biosynthesis protein EgtB n=1 Tax=Lysobacter sp. H21R4 TaxID=2781021 RepID=UPI001889AC5F|nr:ergothioneine biosynthesis protein EgtB [Lysobacter sp. H21R4]QOY62790.1 ergothioneine biosynthesis protein EgtB [Lysobacter sp. H21R4]
MSSQSAPHPATAPAPTRHSEPPAPPSARQSLPAAYRAVRERSVALAAPVSAEDAMLQSMEETSPTKWHLAHTTWFFERFVLAESAGYQPVNADWDYLFNSYYQSVGPMHARHRRGMLSRPSLAEVLDYRRAVDERMGSAFDAGRFDAPLWQRIELGLHHEQQHQELLLTDIKHALWCNPLKPAYRDDLPLASAAAGPLDWLGQDEAIVEIGAAGWPLDSECFAFDNESPRHRVLMPAHALATRPVTNADYRDFIDAGGYRDASLWLSDGWALVNQAAWRHPIYWDEALASEFTLGGMRPIDPNAPVSHLSYYEADAFARWAGARLPTEVEWENAAAAVAVEGNFVDRGYLHPVATGSGAGSVNASATQQLFGDVWEWTSSAYTAYPGFREMPGSLGEYNGKFMSGQQILRGGSCASSRDHLRASYRNFFHAPDRWQFSGLRLARDA